MLMKRILANGLCGGSLLAERVSTLYARRAVAYAQADVVVDTTGVSPDMVVERVVQVLHEGFPRSLLSPQPQAGRAG